MAGIRKERKQRFTVHALVCIDEEYPTSEDSWRDFCFYTRETHHKIDIQDTGYYKTKVPAGVEIYQEPHRWQPNKMRKYYLKERLKASYNTI